MWCTPPACPCTVMERTHYPYTCPKCHLCRAALSSVRPFPLSHGENENPRSGFLTQELSLGGCRGIKPGLSRSRESPAFTAAVSRPGGAIFPRENQNEIQAVRGLRERLTCPSDGGRLWDEARPALVDGDSSDFVIFPSEEK